MLRILANKRVYVDEVERFGSWQSLRAFIVRTPQFVGLHIFLECSLSLSLSLCGSCAIDIGRLIDGGKGAKRLLDSAPIAGLTTTRTGGAHVVNCVCRRPPDAERYCADKHYSSTMSSFVFFILKKGYGAGIGDKSAVPQSPAIAVITGVDYYYWTRRKFVLLYFAVERRK